MSKRKHEVVKELSDIVKEHKKEDLNAQDKIKSHKSLQMKIQVVDEIIRGPKHKARERTALFDPKTAELLTQTYAANQDPRRFEPLLNTAHKR